MDINIDHIYKVKFCLLMYFHPPLWLFFDGYFRICLHLWSEIDRLNSGIVSLEGVEHACVVVAALTAIVEKGLMDVVRKLQSLLFCGEYQLLQQAYNKSLIKLDCVALSWHNLLMSTHIML